MYKWHDVLADRIDDKFANGFKILFQKYYIHYSATNNIDKLLKKKMCECDRSPCDPSK